MQRNEAWVKVGSSVAAAMIGYIVIYIVANQMAMLWKIVIISGAAVIALLVAFWGGKKLVKGEEQKTGTNVGTNITAKGGVTVGRVTIEPSAGGDIKIGSNITAGKDVRIEDIQVNAKGPNNG